jgi:hypothetical protein
MKDTTLHSYILWRRMDRRRMISSEGCDWKKLLPLLSYFPNICLETIGKRTKNLCQYGHSPTRDCELGVNGFGLDDCSIPVRSALHCFCTLPEVALSPSNDRFSRYTVYSMGSKAIGVRRGADKSLAFPISYLQHHQKNFSRMG